VSVAAAAEPLSKRSFRAGKIFGGGSRTEIIPSLKLSSPCYLARIYLIARARSGAAWVRANEPPFAPAPAPLAPLASRRPTLFFPSSRWYAGARSPSGIRRWPASGAALVSALRGWRASEGSEGRRAGPTRTPNSYLPIVSITKELSPSIGNL
jgi:hypothetical protein